MNQPEDSKKLPIGKIILGALVVPWAYRRWFVRNLSTSAILIVALSLLGSQTELLQKLPLWLQVILPFVYIVLWMTLFTRFAVICHRTVLLGADAEIKPYQFFSWSHRERAFLIRLIFVYLLAGITTLVLTQLIGTILGNIATFKSFLKEHFDIVQTVAKVPATYLFARFCLLLPAAALDHRQTLKWAYGVSQGNGIRIAIAIGVLPWGLDWLVSTAMVDKPSLLLNLVYYFMSIVIMVIEISALSITYKELTHSYG